MRGTARECRPHLIRRHGVLQPRDLDAHEIPRECLRRRMLRFRKQPSSSVVRRLSNAAAVTPGSDARQAFDNAYGLLPSCEHPDPWH